MEGSQEKTVCVESKFRVTLFNAYFNSVYKPLIGSFGFSIGCISTHGAAVGKNSWLLVTGNVALI